MQVTIKNINRTLWVGPNQSLYLVGYDALLKKYFVIDLKTCRFSKAGVPYDVLIWLKHNRFVNVGRIDDLDIDGFVYEKLT